MSSTAVKFYASSILKGNEPHLKVHQKISMSHPCTTHHSKSKAFPKRYFPSDFPYSEQAKEDKSLAKHEHPRM